MAVNKNSTSYTITFAVILVVICGGWLAFLASSLKVQQTANVKNEKRQYILSAVGAYDIAALKEMKQAEVETIFNDAVTSQVFNVNGNVITNEENGDTITAFGIDIVKEYKATIGEEGKRKYPLFTYVDKNGASKYVIPMAGNGLWGPVWGFIAIDSDKNTIADVVFDHKSETPGLGAKITETSFTSLFTNSPKHIVTKDGIYKGVKVVKGGIKNPEHEINAIAGATITSKGVGKMLEGGFKPYALAWDLIKK
jgi:Na+-transporting NADH:ubiquinone oxidoreductase subunit C